MGVLRNPLSFITVVSFILLGSSMVARSWSLLPEWRVDVVNQLSNGQPLVVHCKSKNDDLGIQNLNSGADFGFSFKENIWGTTLFWCYLRKPNEAHSSFEVYWLDISTSKWLFSRCNWSNCIWIGKDDGIYIKNIPANEDELVHQWES